MGEAPCGTDATAFGACARNPDAVSLRSPLRERAETIRRILTAYVDPDDAVGTIRTFAWASVAGGRLRFAAF